MNDELMYLTKGKWRGLLEGLGVDPKYLTGKNGPCPFCGGTDRWRFTNYNNDGMWVCTHCGTGNGFQLLQKYWGWSFPEARRAVEELIPGVRPQKVRRDDWAVQRSINRLRKEAVKAGDVPAVVRYLEARDLMVPPNLMAHRALPYHDSERVTGRFPAMLGELTSPDGDLVGYHRTYLSHNGTKAPVAAPKKLLKLPREQGYAVRLWPVEDTVCIAEGIETAIANYVLWGVPTWSVTSAHGVRNFEPPAGTTTVLVAADNDADGTGQNVADALVERLSAAGYDTDVLLPGVVGEDFADELERIMRKVEASDQSDDSLE